MISNNGKIAWPFGWLKPPTIPAMLSRGYWSNRSEWHENYPVDAHMSLVEVRFFSDPDLLKRFNIRPHWWGFNVSLTLLHLEAYYVRRVSEFL